MPAARRRCFGCFQRPPRAGRPAPVFLTTPQPWHRRSVDSTPPPSMCCQSTQCTLNACTRGDTECRVSRRRPIPLVTRASCRAPRLMMGVPKAHDQEDAARLAPTAAALPLQPVPGQRRTADHRARAEILLGKIRGLISDRPNGLRRRHPQRPGLIREIVSGAIVLDRPPRSRLGYGPSIGGACGFRHRAVAGVAHIVAGPTRIQ
jgi:hypothetical protein